MEKLHCGYLRKSPTSGHHGPMKTWKRRFFMLLKIGDDAYHLKYYESEKDNPLGTIDMSEVLLVLFCPESHSMWAWIHKSFGCTPSCVLILKTADRDYFLIGENSIEMDSWCQSLSKALKCQKSREAMSEKPESCDKKEHDYMEMPAVEYPMETPGGSLLASVAQALQELDKPGQSEWQGENVDRSSNAPSESLTLEIEVCVSKDKLKRHLSLTEEEEKARCSETASTLLMGDEIIAINDINVESVQELERCLGKVQKNEVKVTVRRLSSMEDASLKLKES